MKIIVAGIFAMSLTNLFSQLLSGDLLNDRRPLLSEETFVIKSEKEGVVVYDLSVDNLGNVTSEKLVTAQTTITSTPLRMEAVNYLRKIKFQPGTFYPKYHHVLVKVTFSKELVKE